MADGRRQRPAEMQMIVSFRSTNLFLHMPWNTVCVVPDEGSFGHLGTLLTVTL